MTAVDHERPVHEQVQLARVLATTVLREHAEDVDSRARFPVESIRALREAGLLIGGASIRRADTESFLIGLARVAEELARGCGSTAMIWAMHQVQMMCVEQHHGESSTLSEWLREASVNGCLVASVTSERGTGGDLRSSTAAMERAPEGKGLFTASKAAPTVSFGMQADAFLVTLRTSVEARPTDQVAVLVRREQVTLEPLNTWDPLGMRGTCSPGFQLSAVFDSKQILPDPFSKIAAHTMVPVSHLLWAAVWIGLAAEGLARATRCARRRYRHSSGLPTDRTLAEAHWRLAGARAQLVEFARLYAPVFDARHPATTSFAASANAIKIAASETSLSVAQLALRACGMAGYAERSEFSIARLLRDLHSAPLMIGNERLLATNAAFALTLKGYE